MSSKSDTYYGYGLHFLPAGPWSAQLKAYRDSATQNTAFPDTALDQGSQNRGLQGLSNSHSFTVNKTPAIFLVKTLTLWEPGALYLQVADRDPGK